MSCSVRKATLEDLPQIMRELRSFAEFYGSKKSLYKDDQHTEQVISNMITHHVYFVGEVSGEVVGFISGMLMPHYYNPNIMTLTEAFWWVNEQHRRSRLGLMLLEAFVSCGKEVADWIICTLESESPVNEKTFYKRGFKLKEKSFLMEVR